MEARGEFCGVVLFFTQVQGTELRKEGQTDAGATDGRTELLQEAELCRGSTKISESKSSLETSILLSSCKTPQVQD